MSFKGDNNQLVPVQNPDLLSIDQSHQPGVKNQNFVQQRHDSRDSKKKRYAGKAFGVDRHS
jgi:hypothetical protein